MTNFSLVVKRLLQYEKIWTLYMIHNPWNVSPFSFESLFEVAQTDWHFRVMTLLPRLDPRISLEVRKGLLLILCCAWCNMCLPCSVRTMTFVPDAIQVFEIKTNFIGCFNTGDFVEKLYFMVTSHKFDLWPIVTETS